MADLILAKLFKKQGFHSDRSHCKTVSNYVCLSDVATVTKGGGAYQQVNLRSCATSTVSFSRSFLSRLALKWTIFSVFIFVSTLEVETSNPEGAHLT